MSGLKFMVTDTVLLRQRGVEKLLAQNRRFVLEIDVQGGLESVV